MELDAHLALLVKEMLSGLVVPFFGAGVNLCGRPQDYHWACGNKDYFPSGKELSEYFASSYHYPEDDKNDLLRVSQYISVVAGTAPLYRDLRELFDCDIPYTPLHSFFAGLPTFLHSKNVNPPHQLIVTTNYDDLLECAFKSAGEKFDVVTYIAEDDEFRGKFRHYFHEGQVKIIERPNEYNEFNLNDRTIILKIHGAIDHGEKQRDSFVITEDHYIDFLSRADISTLIPVTLAAILRNSHFLFLGYSLRDWNLRVILHRIWGQQKLKYKSWAIQLNPSTVDQEFWNFRGVDLLDYDLYHYITELQKHISLDKTVTETAAH
jgi:hypothetical protein